MWIAKDNYQRHREHVRAEEDVPYGDHPKQKLDFFLPLPLPTERLEAPLVVFIHGGAWKERNRRFYRSWLGLYSNVGMALARRGIATAIAGYRQTPHDIAPSIEDLTRALAWLRQHRSANPVLMGHSAGAHLASWLALDPARPRPPGLIVLGGFYDIPRFTAALPRIARGQAVPLLRNAASPEGWVTRASPPLFAGIATRDAPSINREQEALIAAYERAGAQVEIREVRTGHLGMVLQLGRTQDALSDPIAEFVRGLRGTGD